MLNKGKHSGAHDLAIDLQIDRVICHGGKNPPLCDLDCIGRFMVLFDVQLLRLILCDNKKLRGFRKLLEKIFAMALVPLF